MTPQKAGPTYDFSSHGFSHGTEIHKDFKIVSTISTFVASIELYGYFSTLNTSNPNIINVSIQTQNKLTVAQLSKSKATRF